MKFIKRSFLLFFVLLIAIQFYNPYKVEYEMNSLNENDIIINNKSSDEVAVLLRNTCYDCHSNITQKYWYSNVAPVSWFINKDITEGRKSLNFSNWESYTFQERVDFAGAIMLQMYEGWMPTDEYIWMHKGAKLTKKEKNKITEWINSLVD